MPVNRCIRNGVKGYKWGNQGYCYTGASAKQKALKQGVAIGKGKLSKHDSEETKDIFKEILFQEGMKKQSKLKVKKPPQWLIPLSSEKTYEKELQNLMRRFSRITVKMIKPVLGEWNKEIKAERNDNYVDDFRDINKRWRELQNEIFGTEEDNLLAELFGIGTIVSLFNKKQKRKVIKRTVGVEYDPIENWENNLLQTWINENVSLITGLTNEYIKKINTAISNAFTTNQTAASLAKELTKINNTFTKSRVKLIARDQINKLNGKLTEQRQRDVGVTIYQWQTARDERVRKTHKPLHGKYCKWDDATVYADTLQDALNNKWKKRSSINAVELHPGIDINCRCVALPVLDNIVENVNEEIRRAV